MAAGVAPPEELSAAAPGLPVFSSAEVWQASVNSYAGKLEFLPSPKLRTGRRGKLARSMKTRAGHLIPCYHPERPRRSPHPVTMHVWLHFGIHWVTARTPDAPLPPDAPFPDADENRSGVEGRCYFHPLRRYRPDSRPTVEIHIHPAPREVRDWVHALSGTATDEMWNVELEFPEDPADDGLIFVAPTRANAEEWKRQLQLRVVPLETLWKSQQARTHDDRGPSTTVPRGRGEDSNPPRPAGEAPPQPATATNGTAGAPRRLVRPPRGNITIALAIQQALRSNLAAAFVGVCTATLQEPGFNMATSAAGLGSVLILGPLFAAAAACRSVQSLPVVAAELRTKVRTLGEALMGYIYPAVKLLAGLPGDVWTNGPAGPVLTGSIEALSSDLDVMLGRLFNMSLMSTKQRISKSAAPVGSSPQAELMEKVDALKAEVTDLLDWTMIQLVTHSVGQLERIARELAALREAQERAARDALASHVAAHRLEDAVEAQRRLLRAESARFVNATTPPRPTSGGECGTPESGRPRRLRKRDILMKGYLEWLSSRRR